MTHVARRTTPFTASVSECEHGLKPSSSTNVIIFMHDSQKPPTNMYLFTSVTNTQKCPHQQTAYSNIIGTSVRDGRPAATRTRLLVPILSPVYTIQPVVKPNRVDNRLYRVNGVSFTNRLSMHEHDAVLYDGGTSSALSPTSTDRLLYGLSKYRHRV